MSFSQEYLGALAIVIVSVLKMFKIELANDEVTSILVGIVALYVAIRRRAKGDINNFGKRV